MSKLSKLSQADLSTFAGFSAQNWTDWIEQRMNGLDSCTSIPVERDLFPYMVVPKVYFLTTNHNVRESLIAGVLGCIENNLAAMLSSGPEVAKPDGLLTASNRLAASLEILREIPQDEMPQRTKTLIREVWKVARDRIEEDDIDNVVVEAFGLAVKYDIRIGERWLKRLLSERSTALRALDLAVSKKGFRTIPKFFPLFMNTVHQSDKKVLIKLAIERLIERCEGDPIRTSELEMSLSQCIRKLSEVHAAALGQVAEEHHLSLVELEPIKSRILARKSNEDTTHSILYVAPETYAPDAIRLSELMGFFKDQVVKRLDANIAERKPLIAPSWGSIPRLVHSGQIDLCLEPYFEAGLRRLYEVGVLPFATISTFTCLLHPNSEFVSSELRNESMAFETRVRNALQTVPDPQIGILEDTAADLEAINAVSKFPHPKFFGPFYSPDRLRNWFVSGNPEKSADEAGPHNRIVFCDWGISKALRHPLPTGTYFSGDTSGRTSDDIFKFRFRTPYRVGIVYPTWDVEWRQILLESFKSSLTSIESIEALDEIASELDAVGIELYDAQKLYERYGLEEHFAYLQSDRRTETKKVDRR